MRLMFKLVVVFVLSLMLLIPLAMVRGTISERQAYRKEAVESVERSYAGAQSFGAEIGDLGLVRLAENLQCLPHPRHRTHSAA
mgnify:CR=1 FL=1